MTTDAWLAIVHHIAVFGLLAVLAAEWGLVRPGLDAAGAGRVARIDAGYGAFAALVLVAGVARLVWGDQPFDYYSEQPAFWLKMASFATVGALSVPPTMRFLQWRALDAPPPEADVAAAQRNIRLQLVVFPLIPIFAALMARHIGA